MSAIELFGPRKIYPRCDGERLSFCFKNETGKPIFDLWIVTGYDSITGFTPELTRIAVTQNAQPVDFIDGLEAGDESDNVHLVFVEPIEADQEFCLTLDFDESFDDDEWVRFSPTDEDGAVIITAQSIAEAERGGERTAAIGRRGGVLRDSAEERRIVRRALRAMGPKLALGAIFESERKRP